MHPQLVSAFRGIARPTHAYSWHGEAGRRVVHLEHHKAVWLGSILLLTLVLRGGCGAPPILVLKIRIHVALAVIRIASGFLLILFVTAWVGIPGRFLVNIEPICFVDAGCLWVACIVGGSESATLVTLDESPLPAL